MGQKVNPHGLRVGVIKNWDSRWFVKDKDFGDTLVSDDNVRKYLKKELFTAGVSKIEIERDPARVRVFVHCAKPGMVIGQKGANIEKLKTELEKMLNKPVAINVDEIKNPDLDAQLVAENIAAQLEIRNTMRLGAKGIKISCGGRLGGAEIARTEHYHEGTIPLQTIRADIEYGFWEANTTYGKIGIKVWIYKGEILSVVNRTASYTPRDNRNRRSGNNDRGDRRNNDRRNNNFRGRDGQNRGDRTPREGGRKNVNA